MGLAAHGCDAGKMLSWCAFPFTNMELLSPEAWSLRLMGLVAGQYRYFQDLLQLESNIPCTPPCSWPRGPSPLSVEAFARCLSSHLDRGFVNYFLWGLSVGFRIGYSHQSHKLRSRDRNHPSCLANCAVVLTHIATLSWLSGGSNPTTVSWHGPYQSDGVGTQGSQQWYM